MAYYLDFNGNQTSNATFVAANGSQHTVNSIRVVWPNGVSQNVWSREIPIKLDVRGSGNATVIVQVTNPFIDTVNPYSSGFFRNPHNAIACFNWGDVVRINATALFGQTITPPSYTTTLRTPNQRFVFTLVTPPYTEQQVSNFIANSPELKLSLNASNVPTVTFNAFPAGAVEFINKNPTAVKIGLFFHRPVGHANYDYLGAWERLRKKVFTVDPDDYSGNHSGAKNSTWKLLRYSPMDGDIRRTTVRNLTTTEAAIGRAVLPATWINWIRSSSWNSRYTAQGWDTPYYDVMAIIFVGGNGFGAYRITHPQVRAGAFRGSNWIMLAR